LAFIQAALRTCGLIRPPTDPRAFVGPKARDPSLDDAAGRAHLDETRTSLRAIAESRGFALLNADLAAGLNRIRLAVGR
jgi:hypothetical protein